MTLTIDVRHLRSTLYGRFVPTLRMAFRVASQAREKGPYRVTFNSEAHARAKAKESEKRDPLFEAALDEYWPQEFARYVAIALALDHPTVKALLRIHEAEKQSISRMSGLFSPKLWLGVALAAGAFFANQVPKELFTYLRSKGWVDVNYTEYRAFAFFALLAACIYFGLMLLSIGSMMGRSSPRQVAAAFQDTKSVLVYLDASYEILGSERDKAAVDQAVLNRPDGPKRADVAEARP